ncbi:serine hydrolase domain-containing protein [Luteimonas sp. RIT-PG2_3]
MTRQFPLPLLLVLAALCCLPVALQAAAPGAGHGSTLEAGALEAATLDAGRIDAGKVALLREDIVRRMRETGTASVAVAVAQHGRILWEEGFGWADRERRIPANAHTLYSLASVSKPMTMTAIMVLVEQGKIDLDRPINDYLGDAKLTARVGDARDATVRRVASHTAGVPVHSQFFFTDEPYPLPTMDETILRYGNLIALPDERSIYSNLGYGLLGYSVERVSGQTFADFMRNEVFLKLGMTHTSVDIGPGLAPYQAIRYEVDGKPIPFYRIPTPGSGDVYSSAHDLALFGMFHLKQRIPGQARIISDAGIDTLATFPGLISKYGGMPGVATVLQVVPSAGLVVVVLANNSWYGPERNKIKVDEIANGIQQALAPGSFAASLPRVDKQQAPVSDLAGTWRGAVHTHVAEVPLTLQVLATGEVRARLGEQPMTLLDKPSFENGWLEGTTIGDIGTPDANRNWPYRLKFLLKQRPGVLEGGLEVNSELMHPPRGEAMTYWVHLRKE